MGSVGQAEFFHVVFGEKVKVIKHDSIFQVKCSYLDWEFIIWVRNSYLGLGIRV